MILTTTVLNTDTAEIQKTIKHLDINKDVLLLYGDFMGGEPLEVQYIQPINRVMTIGVVDGIFLKDVIDKYGDVSLSIASYNIDFHDGMYSLELDINVDDIQEPPEKENSGKKLPLPILLIVGIMTAFLTVILVILKILKKFSDD